MFKTTISIRKRDQEKKTNRNIILSKKDIVQQSVQLFLLEEEIKKKTPTKILF